MRLASFNVENLFDRAVALNQSNWAQGRPALEAVTRLNRLLNKPTYSANDKQKILELLTFLKLDQPPQEQGLWVEHRKAPPAPGRARG